VPQGFPILIDTTGASEHKSKSLLRMGIKIAHLSRDIANAHVIHETQNGAVELSQKTGRSAGARLTGILTQGHVASPVESVFNSPMVSDQRKHARGRSLLEGETTESIDHLMLNDASLEEQSCPFEAKDLFNAFPVPGKPVIEVRTTGDVTVFEPPMPFVPGLSVLPATPIRGRILKQIGNILVQSELIILGK
jgi:hypothetical protein